MSTPARIVYLAKYYLIKVILKSTKKVWNSLLA